MGRLLQRRLEGMQLAHLGVCLSPTPNPSPQCYGVPRKAVVQGPTSMPAPAERTLRDTSTSFPPRSKVTLARHTCLRQRKLRVCRFACLCSPALHDVYVWLPRAIQPTTAARINYACRCNVALGPLEDRMMLTGIHTVTDLYCAVCGVAVGWQYLEAFEESQRYKEARVILEVAKLRRTRWSSPPAH